MLATDDQVRTIATRLADIASNVSEEATALTEVVREVGEHARDIATLAAELDDAAVRIEESTQAQIKLLLRAQEHVKDNEPVMIALAGSAATIAAISTQIADIAARSTMLSLNARIEAARTDGGRGFTAVAGAMTDLAGQTKTATTDIASRAQAIAVNVGAAREVINGGVQFLKAEHRMITAVAETAEQQRKTSAYVARLTAETVERVDGAAAGIGRVASAVSIVSLLARQLLRVREATDCG